MSLPHLGKCIYRGKEYFITRNSNMGWVDLAEMEVSKPYLGALWYGCLTAIGTDEIERIYE